MDFDVVIVGAGVAGGALAISLSQAGFRVLMLERSLEHIDRVRGEYLQPWGVEELQKLGLYEAVMADGANVITRAIPFDEIVSPELALARTRDLSKLVPNVPGCLGYGHPRLCDLLNRMALANGAILSRGVREVRVTPGTRPHIAFSHGGREHALSPRLIVGADGRGSQVGRQAGIAMTSDTPHHLFAGMLVKGTDFWPKDTVTIGTEGDCAFYVIPQGEGRVRLYLGYARNQKARFSGPDGARRFLEAFRLKSLPREMRFDAAEPAGPIHAYPNEDLWAERPVASGIVLIGDAAGYNDPLGGQGLAIALRDVRILTEVLANRVDWTDDAFAPYVAERQERMRRLRTAVQVLSKLRVEFGSENVERRRRALAKGAADPAATAILSTFLLGPDRVTVSAFEPEAVANLLQ